MANTAGKLRFIVEVDDKGTPVVKNFRQTVKGTTDSVSSGGSKMGKAFAGLWKQIAGAQVAVAALNKVRRVISDTIGSAIEFEKEFANVTTLLSGDALEAAGMMQEGLLDMAGELGSVTELTKGMYQTLSAGIKPGTDALKFLEASARFAKAGVMDMTSSVDVLSTVVNAYGRQASEATLISDVLFQTIKDGKITGQELASSLGRVIPAAATLEVELKEVAAAMAVMTKGGIKASEAVVSLNATMMAIIKPGAEAIKTAEKFKIEFSKAGIIGAGGLQKWLAILKEKIGDSETAMAKMFPNVRALKMLFGLTGKQLEEYTKQMGRMDDVSGNVAEAFEKQISTFDGASTAIKNMAEAAIIRGLLPALQDLAAWMRENKDDIINFVKGISEALAFTLKVLGEAIKVGTAPLQTLHKRMQEISEAQRRAAGTAQNYNEMLEKTPEEIKKGLAIFDRWMASIERNKKEVKSLSEVYDEKIETIKKGISYTESEIATMKALSETISKLKVEIYGYTDYSSKARAEIKKLTAEIEKLNKIKIDKEKFVYKGTFQYKYVEDLHSIMQKLNISYAENYDSTKKLYDIHTDFWSVLMKVRMAWAENTIEVEKNKQKIIEIVQGVNQIGQSLLNLGDSLGLDTGKFGSALENLTTGITQAISGDWVGAIASGINLIGDLIGLFEGKDPIEEAIENWTKLMEDFEAGSKEIYDFIRQMKLEGIELDEITDYVAEKINSAISALGDYYKYAAGAQETFNRAQLYTIALFGALLSQGYSFIDVVRMMGDQFKKLREIAATEGWAINEHMQDLLDLTTFMEQNEVLTNAISATVSLMEGMFDSTIFSTEKMQALIIAFGQDAVNQFNQILAAGGTNEQAWALMIPTLEQILYYAQEYGLSIDAQTQALIDQGNALGYNLEANIPPMEKMVILLTEFIDMFATWIGVSWHAPWESWKSPMPSPDYKDIPDIQYRPDIKGYSSGGAFWADEPQLLKVGEGAEREWVSVIPESKLSGRNIGGGETRIETINANLIIDNMVLQPGEDAAEVVLQALDRNKFEITDAITNKVISQIENRLAGD